jgi:hypothetical protein
MYSCIAFNGPIKHVSTKKIEQNIVTCRAVLRGLVRQRTIPTERPSLVGVVPNLADRGCRVVSATNPHGR